MRERSAQETAVIALAGELDLATVGTVQRRLAELRDERRPTVLDLDELTFMDSTGIRLLLATSEEAARDGWEFAVTRGSERVQHVLRIAQVIDRLPYADGAP